MRKMQEEMKIQHKENGALKSQTLESRENKLVKKEEDNVEQVEVHEVGRKNMYDRTIDSFQELV